MDNDNIEHQLDTQDVHSRIAAIEAESDMLARKNETPVEVVKATPPLTAYSDAKSREKESSLAIKKGRRLKVNKWALIGIGGFISLLIALWLVPVSRFAMLNMAGMRSSIRVSSVQAPVDGTEGGVQSQVKNFMVTVDSQNYYSGDSTEVLIPNQKFGTITVEVSKRGYASTRYETTVDHDPFFGLMGVSSEPTVQAKLAAEGLPVSFSVKDWTSHTPVKQGRYSVGDVTAQPDANGNVSFVVPPTAGEKVAVKAEFTQDYLGKSFEVSLNDPTQEVLVVPSSRHYFVSKRSGVYSIYTSYLDGSELKELVKGTNQETSNLQFAVSPSGKYGVMTSTREGKRDDNGDLIQKLYWVNLSNGKLVEMDSARFIYLHDWSGDTITYSYSYQSKDSNEQRQRLRSLDTLKQNQYELGSTTGYFNRVHTSLDVVIFTKQEAFGKPGSEKGVTVHTVGTTGQGGRELATNIGELRQLGFDTFAYETTDKRWNEITINTGQIKSTEPPREEGTVYISTESQKQERVYIDFVDGQRILRLKQRDGTIQELVSQPGLTGPIRFLNATTVVYRVVTPTETADYTVSTLGGEPRKVTDVTASSYASPVFFKYY